MFHGFKGTKEEFNWNNMNMKINLESNQMYQKSSKKDDFSILISKRVQIFCLRPYKFSHGEKMYFLKFY